MPAGAQDILILGLGGLGFQGLNFATAMFGGAPLAADIKPEAREHAASLGATVFDAADEQGSGDAIRALTGGGVFAVVDFVGSSATHAWSRSVIRKGGRVINVGLFGGQVEGFNANLAFLALQSQGVQGSMVGSFPEVGRHAGGPAVCGGDTLAACSAWLGSGSGSDDRCPASLSLACHCAATAASRAFKRARGDRCWR
jgi:threonine dehydrogenase-like Zn-dependent dehydrogenase